MEGETDREMGGKNRGKEFKIPENFETRNIDAAANVKRMNTQI